MDETVMGQVIGKYPAAVAILLLVASFVWWGTADAALQEAELFEKAYGHYLSYEPEKAIEAFDLFIAQFPDSSALDAAIFWRAKSLSHLKRNDEAAKTFREMKERYPQSVYAAFADKELDLLRTPSLGAEQIVVIKDITAPSGDARKAEYEEKIRKLESEGRELADRLSAAEKKVQLTEKGLIKAVEEKNSLEVQLEEAKRKGAGPDKTSPDSEKIQKNYAKLSEEKKEIEIKMKESEEKIKALLSEKEKNQQGLDLLKKELEGKIQESQKDWAKLDEYIKQLKVDNETLKQTVRQKEKEMADAQLKVASLEKKAEESESAGKREKEFSDRTLQEMKSLEAEKKQLTTRLEEQQRKGDEQESRIKKLSTEKAALDSVAREHAVLLEDKKIREAKIKELEGSLQSLSSVRMKEGNTDKEVQDLRGKLQEQEGRYQEAESTVKQLRAERQMLESQIKEKETSLAKTSETISSLQGSLGSLKQDRDKTVSEVQEKLRKTEAEAQKLHSDAAALQKRVKELEAVEQEKKTLDARLKEQETKLQALSSDRQRESGLLGRIQELEKKQKEYENSIRQLTEERQKLVAQIREGEQKLAKASEAAAPRQGGLTETDKSRDRDLQELQQEVTVLKSRIREYEKPVARIGKDTYSISRIQNEEGLALQVQKKISSGPAPWMRRSSLETFIAEETLYRKAGEMGIRADKSEVETLSKKHGLSPEEQEYLVKYLAVEKIYRKKYAELEVSEKEMRAYYEKNRHEFVGIGPETMVETLAVSYSSGEELDQGLFAVALHQEAQEGKKLDDIAKRHRGSASYREVRLETVPLWVRAKIEHLKQGELSSIISSDSEFLIMKIQSRKETPKPYHEVKSDIEMRLAPSREKRKQVMEDWLNAIMREAETGR